jgi:hypothetical protein
LAAGWLAFAMVLSFPLLIELGAGGGGQTGRTLMRDPQKITSKQNVRVVESRHPHPTYI